MHDRHTRPDVIERRALVATVLMLLLLTFVGAIARSSEAFSDAPTVGVAPPADESR